MIAAYDFIFFFEFLLAFLQNLHQFIGCQLLAAARSDDGGVGDGACGGIVKGDAHLGKRRWQTYLANEVCKEVDAVYVPLRAVFLGRMQDTQP